MVASHSAAEQISRHGNVITSMGPHTVGGRALSERNSLSLHSRASAATGLHRFHASRIFYPNFYPYEEAGSGVHPGHRAQEGHQVRQAHAALIYQGLPCFLQRTATG